MSFIIANQKSDQDPAYFTSRYRNELIIPANSEIALYQSQINVNPKITINDYNDEFALMYNYNYTGFAPKTDAQNQVEYEENKYINAQNLMPNYCYLKQGIYKSTELANQLYYASTLGDKSGLNSYVWEAQFDATNNKFQGYKVTVNANSQSTTLNDSSKFLLTQLDDAKEDNETVTLPDATSIKIEKTAGFADAWDCDHMMLSAIHRNGGRAEFQISDANEEFYFGFTRNIKSLKGIPLNYEANQEVGNPLPNALKSNRELENFEGLESEVGGFMDYSVYIENGDIHILYLFTEDFDVSYMKELRYWETGIDGITEIVNTTTDNTLIRFTFDYDMVQVHYSIDDGTTYIQLVRGNEWKGISSATNALYPRFSLNHLTSSITFQTSNCSFLEPQGGINSNLQSMSNSINPEFIPDNWNKLANLNWDFNLTMSEIDIIECETNVCLAIKSRAAIGFNTDVKGYMNHWSVDGTSIVVGDKLDTTDTTIHPFLITESNNILPTTIGNEPTFIFQGDNSIVNITEITSKLISTSWTGTAPAYIANSIKTPTITNSSALYIRIDNLPLETYNSANESISRIIGIMPRFNESRSIGHIYKISNPPVYVKLNNTNAFKLTELKISLINDDESIADDLLSQTQLIFHLK